MYPILLTQQIWEVIVCIRVCSLVPSVNNCGAYSFIKLKLASYVIYLFIYLRRDCSPL